MIRLECWTKDLRHLQVADRDFEHPACLGAGTRGSLHCLHDGSFEVSFATNFADAYGDILDDRKEVITPSVVDHHSTFGDFAPTEMAAIVSSLHDFLRRRKVASHFSGRRLGSYTVIRRTSRGSSFTAHTA